MGIVASGLSFIARSAAKNDSRLAGGFGPASSGGVFTRRRSSDIGSLRRPRTTVVDDDAAHCAKGAAVFRPLSDTTPHKSRLSTRTKTARGAAGYAWWRAQPAPVDARRATWPCPRPA